MFSLFKHSSTNVVCGGSCLNIDERIDFFNQSYEYRKTWRMAGNFQSYVLFESQQWLTFRTYKVCFMYGLEVYGEARLHIYKISKFIPTALDLNTPRFDCFPDVKNSFCCFGISFNTLLINQIMPYTINRIIMKWNYGRMMWVNFSSDFNNIFVKIY